MKIALLGANGRIGQRIAQEALARGHEVKALDARLEDKVSREVRSSAIASYQASHLSMNGTGDWASDLYEQVKLKLSTNAVIAPLALIVICAFSCTLKLFPGPGPKVSAHL